MGEKSESAAKSSIAALQVRALDLVASRPEGIYQSDLRRLLEIDSSKCSKVVSRLQGSGRIRREKVPASSTYLLKLFPDPASSSTTAASTATTPSAAIAPSPSSVPSGSIEEENRSEEKKNKGAGRLGGGILKAHADKQVDGSDANTSAANMDRDLESLIQSDANGRIRRMIDQQIERILEKRIYGQLNRIQHPFGKIESAINSRNDSSLEGKIPIPIKRETDGPTSNVEPDPSAGSYFDCYVEDGPEKQNEEDLDIEGRIGGYFDNRRLLDSHSHIDTYLTEIYLLYLSRATSS